MRKLLLPLIGLLGLALACFGHSAGVDGGADEKMPPEKKSAAEIEKLVKDLGHEQYAVRHAAFNRLAEMPRALPALRRFVNDGDPERRSRVQELVSQLSKKQLNKTLTSIVSQKHEAPLDLLTEVLARNGERMGDHEWKAVLTTISEIKDHVLRQSKTKLAIPDLENVKLVPPERVPPLERRANGESLISVRVAGAQVPSDLFCIECAVAKAGPLKLSSVSTSYLLATGTVSDEIGRPTYCFVFSDQDIQTKNSTECLLIARGAVRCEKADDSVVIEDAALSPAVTLFSMRTVGLTVAVEQGALRIQKVETNSPAAKCGFERHDLILLKGRTALGLERAIREAFATQDEMIVSIRRDGQQRTLALWWWD